MTETQAETIVGILSKAQVRNLASLRAGHQVALAALRGLAKKGTVVRLDDGRWLPLQPVLDAFNRRYPRP